MKRSAAALVLVLLLPSPTTAGHDPGPYALRGTVFDPESSQPMPGALVELLDASNDVKGSATTDAHGAYRIDAIPLGTYVVRVSNPCCAPVRRELSVTAANAYHAPPPQTGGTGGPPPPDHTHAASFWLVTQSMPASGQPILLWGYATRADTGEPLVNAPIRIASWYQAPGQNEPTLEQFTTRVGYGGEYAVWVNAGTFSLSAEPWNADRLGVITQASSDKRLDLPARSSAARVHGTLVDTEGNALTGASLYARVLRCVNDACPAPTVREMRDGIEFIHVPQNASHDAWPHVQANGTWQATLNPGLIELRATKDGYAPWQQTFDAQPGANQVNIALQPIARNSVTLNAQAIDIATGEAVPQVLVSALHQKWNTVEERRTDANGTATLQLRPDATIVTAWSNPNQTRFAAYHYPFIQTLHTRSDETTHLEVLLTRKATPLHAPPEPVRAPDAWLGGWAIGHHHGGPIGNATIRFYSWDFAAWGEASTDRDGSYRVRLPNGYYTVRACADGYFETARTVQVRAGEEATLPLLVAEGSRPRWGYCDMRLEPGQQIIYAAGGPDESSPTNASANDTHNIGVFYSDQAGGLGAYHAAAATSRSPPSPTAGDGEIAAPKFLALVVMLGLAALVHRARRHA